MEGLLHSGRRRVSFSVISYRNFLPSPVGVPWSSFTFESESERVLLTSICFRSCQEQTDGRAFIGIYSDLESADAEHAEHCLLSL